MNDKILPSHPDIPAAEYCRLRDERDAYKTSAEGLADALKRTEAELADKCEELAVSREMHKDKTAVIRDMRDENRIQSVIIESCVIFGPQCKNTAHLLTENRDLRAATCSCKVHDHGARDCDFKVGGK